MYPYPSGSFVKRKRRPSPERQGRAAGWEAMKGRGGVIYYLAGSYSRRAEIAEYAAQIEALGDDVSSRWLIGTYEAKDRGATPREWWQWSQDDLADIDLADAIIAFTEEPGNQGRGGRHVEWGYAVAKEKRLITVGPCESMFYTLAMHNFPTWEQCYSDLIDRGA